MVHLFTCKPSVSHGPTDDKVSARVDVVFCVVVEILCGDDGADDLLHDVGAKGLKAHLK